MSPGLTPNAVYQASMLRSGTEPRAAGGACGLVKIKLRSAGYRLVYRIEDARVTIVVIAVGRRERGEIYDKARLRA